MAPESDWEDITPPTTTTPSTLESEWEDVTPPVQAPQPMKAVDSDWEDITPEVIQQGPSPWDQLPSNDLTENRFMLERMGVGEQSRADIGDTAASMRAADIARTMDEASALTQLGKGFRVAQDLTRKYIAEPALGALHKAPQVGQAITTAMSTMPGMPGVVGALATPMPGKEYLQRRALGQVVGQELYTKPAPDAAERVRRSARQLSKLAEVTGAVDAPFVGPISLKDVAEFSADNAIDFNLGMVGGKAVTGLGALAGIGQKSHWAARAGLALTSSAATGATGATASAWLAGQDITPATPLVGALFGGTLGALTGGANALNQWRSSKAMRAKPVGEMTPAQFESIWSKSRELPPNVNAAEISNPLLALPEPDGSTRLIEWKVQKALPAGTTPEVPTPPVKVALLPPGVPLHSDPVKAARLQAMRDSVFDIARDTNRTVTLAPDGTLSIEVGTPRQATVPVLKFAKAAKAGFELRPPEVPPKPVPGMAVLPFDPKRAQEDLKRVPALRGKVTGVRTNQVGLSTLPDITPGRTEISPDAPTPNLQKPAAPASMESPAKAQVLPPRGPDEVTNPTSPGVAPQPFARGLPEPMAAVQPRPVGFVAIGKDKTYYYDRLLDPAYRHVVLNVGKKGTPILGTIRSHPGKVGDVYTVEDVATGKHYPVDINTIKATLTPENLTRIYGDGPGALYRALDDTSPVFTQYELERFFGLTPGEAARRANMLLEQGLIELAPQGIDYSILRGHADFPQQMHMQFTATGMAEFGLKPRGTKEYMPIPEGGGAALGHWRVIEKESSPIVNGKNTVARTLVDKTKDAGFPQLAHVRATVVREGPDKGVHIITMGSEEAVKGQGYVTKMLDEILAETGLPLRFNATTFTEEGQGFIAHYLMKKKFNNQKLLEAGRELANTGPRALGTEGPPGPPPTQKGVIPKGYTRSQMPQPVYFKRKGEEMHSSGRLVAWDEDGHFVVIDTAPNSKEARYEMFSRSQWNPVDNVGDQLAAIGGTRSPIDVTQPRYETMAPISAMMRFDAIREDKAYQMLQKMWKGVAETFSITATGNRLNPVDPTNPNAQKYIARAFGALQEVHGSRMMSHVADSSLRSLEAVAPKIGTPERARFGAALDDVIRGKSNWTAFAQEFPDISAQAKNLFQDFIKRRDAAHKYLQARGLVQPDEVLALRGVTEDYVHRAYMAEFLADNDWSNYVKKSRPELIDNAVKRLFEDARENGVVLYYPEARQLIEKALNSGNWGEPPGFEGGQHSRGGSTREAFKALWKRSDMSPEFLALKGEIRDGVINLALTVSKQEAIIASVQAFDGLAAIKTTDPTTGLDVPVFLSHGPKQAADGSSWVQLPDTAEFGNLRGMYVPPELKDLATIPGVINDRTWYELSGRAATQYMKANVVLWNPKSWIRNGARTMWSMHKAGVDFFKPQEAGGAWMQAATLLKEYFEDPMKARAHPELDMFIKHDLFFSSFAGNELKSVKAHLARALRAQIYEARGDTHIGRLIPATYKVYDQTNKLFDKVLSGFDLPELHGKLMSFVLNYNRALAQGMKPIEAGDFAAKRVAQAWAMYHRPGAMGRWAKQNPVIGRAPLFLTPVAEDARTDALYAERFFQEPLKEAGRTAANMAVFAAVFGTLAAGARLATGFTDQDKEDVLRTMPTGTLGNNDLMCFLGKDEKKAAWYINMSTFFAPLEYLKGVNEREISPVSRLVWNILKQPILETPFETGAGNLLEESGVLGSAGGFNRWGNSYKDFGWREAAQLPGVLPRVAQDALIQGRRTGELPEFFGHPGPVEPRQSVEAALIKTLTPVKTAPREQVIQWSRDIEEENRKLGAGIRYDAERRKQQDIREKVDRMLKKTGLKK